MESQKIEITVVITVLCDGGRAHAPLLHLVSCHWPFALQCAPLEALCFLSPPCLCTHFPPVGSAHQHPCHIPPPGLRKVYQMAASHAGTCPVWYHKAMFMLSHGTVHMKWLLFKCESSAFPLGDEFLEEGPHPMDLHLQCLLWCLENIRFQLRNEAVYELAIKLSRSLSKEQSHMPTSAYDKDKEKEGRTMTYITLLYQ